MAVPWFHRLYYREALVGEEIRGPLRRTENQGSGYCNQRPDNQTTLTVNKSVLGKIKKDSRIFLSLVRDWVPLLNKVVIDHSIM